MRSRISLSKLRQPEVQDLHPPIFCEEKILRLEVAMNDPFFMSRGQSMRNLQGAVQSLAHRNRPAAQPLPQRLALKQFGHHVRRPVARANIKHSQNVRMIQSSSSQRLLLKTPHPVGVKRKLLRQNLDSHVAPKTRVASAIHLAHAASA